MIQATRLNIIPIFILSALLIFSWVPRSFVAPADPGWEPVNFDPEFQTPNQRGNPVTTYQYWRPNAHNVCGATTNDAYISGGILHTRQNNLNSSRWKCYDNAVAQQGNFPWQTDCYHTPGSPPNWTCPRNSYGLRTIAPIEFPMNLSLGLSFLSMNGTGNYNIVVGLHFLFTDGPQTINGTRFSNLELQLRLSSRLRGADRPVGNETAQDVGFAILYSNTVDQIRPGSSYSLSNYDVRTLYWSAVRRLGLSPETNAVLVGIEPGTEGFGVSIAVDWTRLEIQTYAPEIARADVNFDHTVDDSDIALVRDLVGKCPAADFGRYQWRADVDSSNPCIDSSDVGILQRLIDGRDRQASPPETIPLIPVTLVAMATLTIVVVTAGLRLRATEPPGGGKFSGSCCGTFSRQWKPDRKVFVR